MNPLFRIYLKSWNELTIRNIKLAVSLDTVVKPTLFCQNFITETHVCFSESAPQFITACAAFRHSGETWRSHTCHNWLHPVTKVTELLLFTLLLFGRIKQGPVSIFIMSSRLQLAPNGDWTSKSDGDYCWNLSQSIFVKDKHLDHFTTLTSWIQKESVLLIRRNKYL